MLVFDESEENQKSKQKINVVPARNELTHKVKKPK